jgi:hypothetical protein
VADRYVGGRPVRAIVLDFNGTLAPDDQVVAPRYVETIASVASVQPTTTRPPATRT